ncbi:hypothetical protein [Grimontia sp. AD028]|uniref:hypothetical protein n=1 Tax=Grimontia sp. AD028 TaxID=1581149 RepID=UPI000A4547E8|nr:hypothetical protein [Grimontia sp. AD028]
MALLLFGVVLPSIALYQAANGVDGLTEEVNSENEFKNMIDNYDEMRSLLANANDYAFISLVFVESSNQKTMINKQVMKVAIINIGFAVISIGMMMIILGINDGGASGKGGFGDIVFDFRTGSTGIVVFVIGATMATLGAVMKNEYQTAGVPGYGAVLKGGGELEATKKLFTLCGEIHKGEPNEIPTCFYDEFKNNFLRE